MSGIKVVRVVKMGQRRGDGGEGSDNKVRYGVRMGRVVWMR